MKTVFLSLAMSVAFVSCGAGATGKVDLTNPFDHATRTELKAEATTRGKADDKLQSQITQHGYEINTQAKYTTSVNEDLQASKAAGVAAYNQVQGQIGSVNGRVDGLQQQTNAVQNAAQIANEKADAGAVRADGIEKSLAVTDGRSINNAVRLDGVESNVGKNTAAIGQTNTNLANVVSYQNGVNNQQTSTNQHVQQQVTTINDVNASQQTQINTATTTNNRQDVTLGQHSAAITQQADRQQAFEDYSRDMDSRLGGRLDSLQSETRHALKVGKQAQEMAVGAAAIAMQQFCTGLECGFQSAVSVANSSGINALSIGLGGAISENWFINGAVSKSGSTTTAGLSVTTRW